MAVDPDTTFFNQHPDRYAHIRKPFKGLYVNKQRAVGYADECEREFRALGEHVAERRRILLWRMPADNHYYDPEKPQILKIPFLLFADETVEDTDEVLLPIIHDLMVNEAMHQGVAGHA